MSAAWVLRDGGVTGRGSAEAGRLGEGRVRVRAAPAVIHPNRSTP